MKAVLTLILPVFLSVIFFHQEISLMPQALANGKSVAEQDSYFLGLPNDGQVLERSFVHEDSLRSYLLYVPAAYDGTVDWPLVINYHGFSNAAADQMYISQMNLVADTAHFLIAYPQGLLVNNPVLGFSAPGWNVDGTMSDNDDVDFSSQLINQISADYAVDPLRVYVTGWSIGGRMAFQLSCELPDRIAAVASVASKMSDGQLQSCNPGRPFSALWMRGTADPIAPFEGDGGLFSPAPNTPSYWAARNNCSPDSLVTDLEDMVTTDASTVTLIEYIDCDANTEVLFYQINGGGHAWPGGGDLPPSLGKVNRDINASSEIWNFFNRNPHPGLPSSAGDAVEPMFEQVRVYPNPSHGEITIELNLKKGGVVQMRLFSLLGQPVGSIVNQHFPSGQQQYIWNPGGNDLSPGTYFIQIRFGTELWSQPILINPN